MYEPLGGAEMAIVYTKVMVCTACGAVFFSGYGWDKSFAKHDEWHQKLDGLLNDAPAM